jgi:hypothetical protein
MNSKKSKLHRFPIVVLVVAAVAFVAGCSKKPGETATAEPQKTFSSPAEAGQALHAAVAAKDDKAVGQVLGTQGKQLVSSGDSSEDAQANEAFAKKYERMNRLVVMTDGSQMLYVGADNYPFPIPLAQDSSARWYFDAAAGEKELAARRIGRNELYAMDTIQMIAHDKDLAQQKTLESHGYSFRVVKEKSGSTVFASPVSYQKSGIMTFSMGPDGVIYQQDLNPANASGAIDQYKPSNGWVQAE